MRNLSQLGRLFWEAALEWKRDHAALMSAALAFYTLFSVAPLLIIAIAVAGFFFGHLEAQEEILGQVQSLVGEKGAAAIARLVREAREPRQSAAATLLAAGTFLLGASVAFYHLQEALNAIWKVKTKSHGGLWNFVVSRLTALSIVLITGFFMLVSLLINAALELLNEFYQAVFTDIEFIWRGLNTAISIVVATVLFALIFKYIPHAKIRWREVWLGAVVTAVLFTLGKHVIGLYLGHSSVASLYGAAGSLVVVLVWIYYSSQILFYGAELTRAYARHFGVHSAQSM